MTEPGPLGSKAILGYVLLALALSWSIQIPTIYWFGLDSTATTVLFVVVMWSPTMLAFAFMLSSPAARSGVRWRLGRLRYLPIGIAVQTSIGFAVVVALLLAGIATSATFSFTTGGAFVSGGPWVLGGGSQGWPLFALNVAATAILYSAISLVATTGEEFAWRGFLQGHLEQHSTPSTAILLVAVVWWAWHLPGLIAGYNFPETPYLGALVLFPLQMLGASFFLGWLTIRSGSFWPAALAHGAVNSIQQGVIDDLEMDRPALYADVIRTVLIVLVGIACWAALRRSPSGPGSG